MAAEKQDFEEWLTEIDDDQLVARAAKMDLDLDDILCGGDETAHNQVDAHRVVTPFGHCVLGYDIRRALRKAIRDRLPAYRKERREFWDFVLKGIAVVIGLIGGISGLVAVLKK